MFISCKPTLTSFYSKNPYPRFLCTLPTSNQHKTCMNQIPKIIIIIIIPKDFYLPTYPTFFGLFPETNNFLKPYILMKVNFGKYVNEENNNSSSYFIILYYELLADINLS